ncbi:MAG: amidohydrolase family protein [Gemmatimonadaceae bacterium]|nr:amidohydrolase family protein [Gemmatimonadaceae bacterium]
MLRYHARWIVPISSAPIENGTVVVEGERIAYVGPRANAPRGADRDLGDAILLPGLVNAHTHLELTVMRGLLEDLAFRDWIVALQAAKRAVMTPEMLLDSARLGIAEGIRAGITTFADTCDSGVVLTALHEAGVRGIMYQEAFGPSPDDAESSLRGLREKIASHMARVTSLQSVGVSPHAPYTVSAALFAGVAGYARDANLPMAIHIAESEAEQSLIVSASGPFAEGLRARGITVEPAARSPIALLRDLGVLQSRPLLIHCVRADRDDINTIATTGCPVAHCPASNAKLGHGIAPVTELLDAGVRVGLGSDSMASNNRMHLLEEARVAALMQRARTGRHDALTPSEALQLATIGSARSLGLDARIGSLEVGKDADLAAFPVNDHAAFSSVDPVATAIFALGGSSARFVSVAGRPLVEDGRLLEDDPTMRARASEAALSLLAWRSGQGMSNG